MVHELEPKLIITIMHGQQHIKIQRGSIHSQIFSIIILPIRCKCWAVRDLEGSSCVVWHYHDAGLRGCRKSWEASASTIGNQNTTRNGDWKWK